MGFNSAFKGLIISCHYEDQNVPVHTVKLKHKLVASNTTYGENTFI